MPVVKRIVCLANSRKPRGRCVAGKEWPVQRGSGIWVRPVSNRPTEEVSTAEMRYEGGGDPGLLDVIDVPLLGPHPTSFQTENWLLDPDERWKHVAQVPIGHLTVLTDNPPALWVNGSSSTGGLNNRVSVAEAAKLRDSLYLLHLDKAQLEVFAPGEAFGDLRLRVHVDFAYRGIRHSLRVTDPVIEREYKANKEGDYQIGECYVTVSLAQEYEGYCYKLAAALIMV